MTTRTQGGSRAAATGPLSRSEHKSPDELSRVNGVEIQPLATPQNAVVVIIDQRTLIRDCLVKCLKETDQNCTVLAFRNVMEWLATEPQNSPALILLCLQCRKPNAIEVMRELSLLVSHGVTAPVAIMSDIEDMDFIVSVLEGGARGYIPTSLTLDVALEAMHFVEAGGIFAPASNLVSWKRTGQSIDLHSARQKELFTARQSSVLAALKRGKANKQIAYELNMREGTVKVHVRHIMKKLKAKNRTEAVIIANGLFASVDEG